MEYKILSCVINNFIIISYAACLKNHDHDDCDSKLDYNFDKLLIYVLIKLRFI